MHIEVYRMTVNSLNLEVTLEAVCDSFSSFLWDVEYYSCGAFEIYIAATPQNLSIFKRGRIIGRSDDRRHYGIIEKIQLNADAENGDYLTISGRFLMSLLARRIIYSGLYGTSVEKYGDLVHKAVRDNCTMIHDIRAISGLKIGGISGDCWNLTTQLQTNYENLMEWIYTICEIVGGTANIRLDTAENGGFPLIFELSQGTDRSILQNENPHIIFSDTYNNLLSFDYTVDSTNYRNTAYTQGERKGNTRIFGVSSIGEMPQYLERYEIYVDAAGISRTTESGEIPDKEYSAILQQKGRENLVPITETSESTIAVDGRQYQYNRDYFLGDYVTVKHQRFGLIQPKIQLVGMIESFDSNGHQLTPKFKGA